MTSPDSRFRQFILGVYGAEGVSAAALLLQEENDVDVNLVLFAAYVGAVQGRALRPADVRTAQDRVGDWQAEVVSPLRALRTRLKTGPGPAPGTATADLRESVKRVELDAEMIEVDELACVAEDLDTPPATGTATERAAAAIEMVVTQIIGRRPGAVDLRRILLIAAATAQYAEEGQ